MNEIIRKAILFGVGVYHLSREKVEKFIRELEKDGQITPEEGKKLVEEVISRLDVERAKLGGEIDRIVKQVLTEVNSQSTKKSVSEVKEAVTEKVAEVKAKTKKAVAAVKKKVDADQA
jgi:polyhydroxyalkanoate synthesis regulator phasin